MNWGELISFFGNHWIDLIGYLGMALVLLSMMMTSTKKLRWFNLAGSVVSMIYGAIDSALPTLILNLSLAIINIVQLVRLKKQKD